MSNKHNIYCMSHVIVFLLFVIVLVAICLSFCTRDFTGGSEITTCLFTGSSTINSFWPKKQTNLPTVIPFPGSTVKGLGKPDSPVRAKLLAIAPKYTDIYLYFGEVDLMFSPYYDVSRAIRQSPVQIDDPFWKKFIDDRVSAYADFINELKKANPDVFVTVIVPWYNPVDDVEKWLTAHCVAVTPEIRPYFSRKFRDGLVDQFAKAVRSVPADRFIDIRNKIAPAGRVLDKYKTGNPVDHHLGNGVQDILIAERIFSKCRVGDPMQRRKDYVPRCSPTEN